MALSDEVKKRVESGEIGAIDAYIEESSKIRSETSEKIKGGLIAFFRIVPLILINILGAVIIGLDNFVEGTWEWGIFLTASFWYSYLSYQTANWVIAITWFTNQIKKLKKQSTQYNQNLAYVQEMVDEDHTEEFIQPQVEIEEVRRKKETLEIEVYRKMYNIRVKNNLRSIDDFMMIGQSRAFSSNKKGWKHKREINKQYKLYDELVRLKEMLSLDWQKKYLKSYKIKHTKVTRELLVSGLSPRNKKGRYNDYKTHFGSTTFKAVVPSAVATSIIGLVLLSFQFVFKEATVYTWLKFAVQIMLIMWNTFMILSTAHEVFKNTHENALEQRRNDLGVFRKRHKEPSESLKDVIEIVKYNKEKSVA